MVKRFTELFLTFAKVGVMTFGGGYAMLPILQREVVENKGWATEEELTDYFAIGQCTPGVSAVKPSAAFYIFPKLDIERFGIVDDERFVLDFLREKHVLLVRGMGFHWEKPDHFRIVYLPEIDILRRSTEQLRSFLETYRQI